MQTIKSLIKNVHGYLKSNVDYYYYLFFDKEIKKVIRAVKDYGVNIEWYYEDDGLAGFFPHATNDLFINKRYIGPQTSSIILHEFAHYLQGFTNKFDLPPVEDGSMSLTNIRNAKKYLNIASKMELNADRIAKKEYKRILGKDDYYASYLGKPETMKWLREVHFKEYTDLIKAHKKILRRKQNGRKRKKVRRKRS